MKQPIKLSLAIALALGSPAAWALGLGGITVKSGLNEPLVAEIVINEAAPGEAEGVRAKLASAEDFARVGLDLSGVAVPLSFDVVRDAGGRAVIQVSSESPVREPFLSFLVEVSWSNGRLLREYSVLLDPPVVAPAVIGTRTVVEPVREAAPVATPEPLPPSVRDAAPPVAAEPAPQPAPQRAATPPPPVAAPAPAEPEPAPAPAASTPGEYGPVAAGETLWEIATSTRPEGGVTLNQMMLAIVRANPDAFIRGNANALKRGAVLRIPAAEEARAVAIADAAAEIAAQNEAWRATSRPTLVADSGAPAPEGSSPAATPARDDSRLELVPPRAGAGGGSSGADRPGAAGGTDTSLVRADLARAREQLASREQEAGELRSRVQELERIQEDKSRLVNLKDSEIAALQQRLREMQEQIDRDRAAQGVAPPVVEAAPEPVPVEPTPAPVLAEPVVEAPVVEVPPAEPAPAEPIAAVDGEGGTPSATEPATAEPVVEAPVEPEVTPVPEAEPAPAVAIEDAPAMPWWRENLMLIGASGALLLGGLLLLALRGRRKAPAKAASVAGGRSSVADSFSSGVFGGAAGEAMGEGEEAALIDQLATDPTDLELHLALLRHYHAGGDAEKFEGAADAMYAQVVDAQAPAWVEACIMGRELLPGNPLFQSAPAADDGEFDFGQVEGDGAPAEQGFDLGSSEIETIEPPRENDPFDFSLEAPSVSKPEIAPVADVRRGADDMFNTAEMAAPPLASSSVPEPATAPGGDAAFFDGDDAVGTKLDLARAYLDMGDPEGARSMLQEVIAEGTDAQQQEARRLLAEIG